MSRYKTVLTAAALLLLPLPACYDLTLTNPNAPDADRVFTTPEDFEALIAGSLWEWWQANGDYGDASFALSTTSFQHSSWTACGAGLHFSQLPRRELPNDLQAPYCGAGQAGQLGATWNQAYVALAAARQGLLGVEVFARDELVASLDEPDLTGADRLARMTAFAKLVQGLGHGSLALFHDRAIIIDEEVLYDGSDIQTEDFDEPKPYPEVVAAALDYFAEAIEIASAADDFTIPPSWMGGTAITRDQFIGIVHGLRARYRTAVARTPVERAAVDWAAVIADLDGARPWTVSLKPFDYHDWTLDIRYYLAYAGWQQLSYWIHGMADQSGTYQRWVEVPNDRKMPDVDGVPFLIITPDQRFAQGATFEEQRADSYDRYPRYGIPPFSLQSNWRKPERGTWRWSYYWTYDLWTTFSSSEWTEVSQAELDLLRAEALYRLNGNAPTAEAAALVDRYRTAAGLDPSLDGNDLCVPKLPDGRCGDFFEMLKWEKRIETQFRGLHGAPWYFEGRGWGDLYQGTALHFPIPCGEAHTLRLLPCYTFGGVEDADGASPGSIYDWPTEL